MWEGCSSLSELEVPLVTNFGDTEMGRTNPRPYPFNNLKKEYEYYNPPIGLPYFGRWIVGKISTLYRRIGR